jgi:hypothetical protein
VTPRPPRAPGTESSGRKQRAAGAMDPEVLQNFLSITGADEGVALNVLESTNWVLEDAVNLFFGTGGEGLGGGGPAPAAAGAAARGGGGAASAGAGAAGAGSGGGSGGGVIGPEDFEDQVGKGRRVGRSRMERMRPRGATVRACAGSRCVTACIWQLALV